MKNFFKNFFRGLFIPTMGMQYPFSEEDAISLAKDLVDEVEKVEFYKRMDALVKLPPVFDRNALRKRLRQVVEETNRIMTERGQEHCVSLSEGEFLRMSPYVILKFDVS